MPDVAVAVVGAETPGNVGTIARAMKNFGLEALYLVDPPDLDPDGEAYGFAGQAREDVLPNARETTFDDLVANYHTVGTTAVTNEDETSHVRYPFTTPAALADSLADVEADTCVVFGRERVGLTNDELARLDQVCSIPAAADYPVLNLGQAATIVLYELRELTLGATQHPDERHQRADERAVEETVTRIVDDHGRLDHLLNVAGTWRGGAPVESTPLETYRLLIDVNLTTAFLTTKHALPHLQETGGAVCSVSARSSLEGGEGDGPYRIARAGVRLLTETVAEENLGTVRANCVLPSVLDTPTNRETMAPSEEWVDPTDVATVMAFLCSAGASPTSGAAVPVYGEV